ncbi:hypothetical protein SAMN04488049_1359 [Tritonibacter multivorans]|nr:hypothetical protein SAMN04488049_1359 [Tritonibacter multivorans]
MGQIGRKAGTTILHGPRTAEAHGRPLNTFVTIRFWQLGSTSETIEEDFRFLKARWFQPWSSRGTIQNGRPHLPANGTPTYSHVHENPTGKPHTHWSVHIKPENADRFEVALKRRLRRQFGLDALPFQAVDVRPVTNAEGVKLYMAKTLDPHFAALWRIRSEDGGHIRGRRADSSRNLGPSTWQPLKAEYRARSRS